jgi:hypothetical protein
LNVSIFKIGIILSIIGAVWISVVFLEGNRISEEFLLEPSSSNNIRLEFVGNDIGYYEIFMPEFSGEEVFVQVLDSNKNIISEQSVQTKMSVGYFDFDKNGEYSVRIANISENSTSLQVELGDTNSRNMIPPGVIVLVGTLMIIVASYMKLSDYKIAHPDENIS